MAGYIKTYAPQDVVVAWGGAPITGFADDTFVEATFNSDLTDEVIGAQGEVALTKIANYTGTVTITLLQNAPANLALANVYLKDQRASDVSRANLTITDPSGSLLMECQDAHLKTFAPVTLGAGQNAKSWTFFVSNMIPFGSNSNITTLLGIASQVNAFAEVLGA